MMKLDDKFLKGSYPPLVTPFKDDGSVDYATYERLVDYHCREGSHGIVVTGTTGEPSTLVASERTELLKVAVKAANGRIPVVAATGTQDHATTIEMTVAAEKAGADAVMVVTPYFVRPPQRGLAAYYIDLCGRTALPTLIYHIPGRAAVNMTADTIASIVDKRPNLVGIKHAAFELALVSELLIKLGPEFRIFVGLEELSFPMLCLGAHGLMNAAGNLAAAKISALYEAVARGDLKEGRRLHYDTWELNAAIFFDTNPTPMKYMMLRMGLLPNENHRLPMMPSTPELRTRLDAVLNRAGLLTAKAAE